MPYSSGDNDRGIDFEQGNTYLRARLINIFLAVFTGLDIILIVYFLFAFPPFQSNLPREIVDIYISTIFTLISFGVIYLLKRLISVDIASIVLLILIIVGIVISDLPEEVTEGRTLIYFSLPIVIASVIYRPWASFAVAGISSLVVTFIELQYLNSAPNGIALVVFFILALAAWLFSRAHENALRSLYQLNEKTRKADEEIRSLAKFPTENPNPVMRVNNEGKLIFANQASQEILGDWECQVGEMIPEKWKEIVVECFSTNDQKNLEMTIGGKIYSVYLVPIFESNYVNLYGRDITKRIQSVKALRESEQRYRQLFNTMQSGFVLNEIVYDAEGKPVDFRFLEINPAIESITGLKINEIIGKTLSQTMPEIESEWFEMYRNIAMTGKPAQFKQYFKPLDKYFEFVAFRPSTNQIAVLTTDVTEREKTSQALKTSITRERLLADMLDHASLPFAIGRPDGSLEEFNAAFSEMLGYSQEEFHNFSWIEDITPPEWRKIEQDHLSIMNLTGQPVRYEKELIRKDGTRVPVELLVQMINDDKGKPDRYYAFITDLTERKKAEDEIHKLNIELEQRVIDRTEQLNHTLMELESFAYSVSHDLRAPLRAIDGFSQALSNEYSSVLTGDGLHYLERVRAGVKRMDQLISDVLKLSRVTRQQINYEQVDLSKIAHRICEELTKNQPERNVEWEISDGLKTYGDANLLKLAIENLLSNAWKFTATRETAKIEFNRFQENGSNTYYVRDNGVGFDMDYANKLFGAFQRLHSAKEFPGTGIGLATVQRIIHRHGGNIWAESLVDQGAVFYFTLDERNIG